MRSLGLTGAHSFPYKFSRVVDMLNANKPVIIYSIPAANILNSHCWNIDGYKVKERKVRTCTYLRGKLLEDNTETETSEMVHCDFGWAGYCNGYYVSGVFKLNDEQVELDSATGKREDTNYNIFTHVVTY